MSEKLNGSPSASEQSAPFVDALAAEYAERRALLGNVIEGLQKAAYLRSLPMQEQIAYWTQDGSVQESLILLQSQVREKMRGVPWQELTADVLETARKSVRKILIASPLAPVLICILAWSMWAADHGEGAGHALEYGIGRTAMVGHPDPASIKQFNDFADYEPDQQLHSSAELEYVEKLLDVATVVSLTGTAVASVGSLVLYLTDYEKRRKDRILHGLEPMRKKGAKVLYLTESSDDPTLKNIFAGKFGKLVFPIAANEDACADYVRQLGTGDPVFVNLDARGRNYVDTNRLANIKIGPSNILTVGDNKYLIVVGSGVPGKGFLNPFDEQGGKRKGVSLHNVRAMTAYLREVLEAQGHTGVIPVPIIIADRSIPVKDRANHDQVRTLADAVNEGTMHTGLISPRGQLASAIRTKLRIHCHDSEVKFTIVSSQKDFHTLKDMIQEDNGNGAVKLRFVPYDKRDADTVLVVMEDTGRSARYTAENTYATQVEKHIENVQSVVSRKVLIVTTDAEVPGMNLESTQDAFGENTEVESVALGQVIAGKIEAFVEALQKGTPLQKVKEDLHI